MVTAESFNTEQKEIYFKAYKHLTTLENDLNLLKEEGITAFQISILGKVSQFYLDKNSEISKDPDPIKMYWRKTHGKGIPFGDFHNSDIGNIFVAGTLVSIFLHKTGSKTLGMLSVGPYGILRGIGASETQSTHYLQLLRSGNYLLIFRGFEDKLEILKKIVEEAKKV